MPSSSRARAVVLVGCVFAGACGGDAEPGPEAPPATLGASAGGAGPVVAAPEGETGGFQLSPDGPRFTDWRRVASDPTFVEVLTGGRHVVVGARIDGGGSSAWIVHAREPDRRELLATVSGRVHGVHCLDEDATRCLVVEAHADPEDPSASKETKDAWLIDRGARSRTRLGGPWDPTAVTFASAPLAPDFRHVAAHEWVTSDGGKRVQVLHVLPVGGRSIRVQSDAVAPADVVGWRGSGAALRAVVRFGLPWGGGTPIRHHLLDPFTGELGEEDVGDGVDEVSRTSPDGRFTFDVDGDSVLHVTETATGETRKLTLPRLVASWVREEGLRTWGGPRHLFLSAPRPALLDLETLQAHDPLAPGDEVLPFEFAPDFSWILGWRDDTLEVGRIEYSTTADEAAEAYAGPPTSGGPAPASTLGP